MMAFFIALTLVAVERFINRKRLRLHEVLADVGWWTLIFTGIEFGYLFFVEAYTLNHGSMAWLLWPTEWPVFKDLLLDAAMGVVAIFLSVLLESTNIELKRPHFAAETTPQPKTEGGKLQKKDRCNIEWHEAT